MSLHFRCICSEALSNCRGATFRLVNRRPSRTDVAVPVIARNRRIQGRQRAREIRLRLAAPDPI
jgi:hypothetical protein